MLSLQLVPGPGQFVVRVGGQLDADSARRLQETADVVLDGTDKPDLVVLDCADLELCDSSGMSTMIMIHRRLVDRGGVLRPAGLSESVARMFELTGLDRFIALYPAPVLALAGSGAPALRTAGEE